MHRTSIRLRDYGASCINYITYNKLYETYHEFAKAIINFFERIPPEQ